MKNPPDYVPGHGLLRGKTVLVTAAAGAGIGFAVAKRAAEEGCRALFISDVHERRLNEAVQTLQKETGLQAIYSQLCDVSQEAQVQALIDQANSPLSCPWPSPFPTWPPRIADVVGGQVGQSQLQCGLPAAPWHRGVAWGNGEG